VRKVYESITYEELKSLPRDQKIEALKELKALYPTQKKIAEKLGVNPANIYNMIAKYVKAEDEGRPKAGARAGTKAAVKAVREAAKPTEGKAGTEGEIKAGAKDMINAGAEGEIKAGAEGDPKAETSVPQEKRVRHKREKKMKAEENLLITLSKSLTGEEAQTQLMGIGSMFLKNHDYRLEIRISET
jgi:hypothetical protein